MTEPVLSQYTSIVQAVNKILAEYAFALTLRQIYYRLVSAALIPNKRSAYNQLSKMLVKARENYNVDDTHIEDRARQVLKGEHDYDGPEQFMEIMEAWFRGSGEGYHADLWGDQDVFVEVWVEKDALSRGAPLVVNSAIRPVRVGREGGRAGGTYCERPDLQGKT